MVSVEFNLEALTPTFLGGADPQGDPELRPASFRGVLRFWWRALYGGVVGNNSLNELRRTEGATFGTTDYGSPVVIRLRGKPKPQSFASSARGVQYLFWSLIRSRRRCLPAGSQYTLILQTRPGLNDNQPLQGALASLWLLTHLGGIGARARRGAGCLQVVQHPQTKSADWFRELGLPDFEIHASQPNQLRDELAQRIAMLRSLFGTPSDSSFVRSDFSVLHPDCCRIVVLDKTWNTWEQALNEVGEEFQTFRNRHPSDYEIVKDAIRGRTDHLRPVERAAFGLPIVFYYRSLRGQGGTLEGEDHNRRASPLLIRVLRLANPRFVVVLTIFKSQLLDEAYDEKLKLRRRGGPPAIGELPDLSIIDTFVDTLGPRLEVNF
jgi:CRISPR-associated protein Cmr1